MVDQEKQGNGKWIKVQSLENSIQSSISAPLFCFLLCRNIAHG